MQVQGARMEWKIYVKKTNSLRVRISEGEEVMLGNEKIDQIDSFTCLGSITNKNGWYSQNVDSRKAKVQGVFHSWKKFGKIGR